MSFPAIHLFRGVQVDHSQGLEQDPNSGINLLPLLVKSTPVPLAFCMLEKRIFCAKRDEKVCWQVVFEIVSKRGDLLFVL